jgi:anti-sigma-K factor RskA
MTPQLEELASLYVLDRLVGRARADFEERLSQDRELALLVRALETTIARRVRLLPQHKPPADLFDRISAQLDSPAAKARSRARTSPAWTSWVPWSIAAAFALGLGVTSTLLWQRDRAAAAPVILVVGLDADRSTLATLPMRHPAANADARYAQLAAIAEKFWDDPARLPTERSDTAARGYAVFDPESRQGFIAVRQLPQQAHQQRYHLWVVDTATGRATEAGVIPAAASDGGLYSFSLSPDAPAEARQLDVFITAEDASFAQPAQPSNRVVLGGKRI